jgi:hypothetical protein
MRPRLLALQFALIAFALAASEFRDSFEQALIVVSDSYRI